MADKIRTLRDDLTALMEQARKGFSGPWLSGFESGVEVVIERYGDMPIVCGRLVAMDVEAGLDELQEAANDYELLPSHLRAILTACGIVVPDEVVIVSDYHGSEQGKMWANEGDTHYIARKEVE